MASEVIDNAINQGTTTFLSAPLTKTDNVAQVGGPASSKLQTGQFRALIFNPANGDAEIVLVTNGQNTAQWIIERAQETTTAKDFPQNCVVKHIFTEASLRATTAARTASAYLLPSGGDDSAAMAAALTSFVPFVSPDIVLGPGTFQWNSTVPTLIRATYAGAPVGTNIPTRITGAGIDQTFIKLSAAVPRAFDFNKVADYDTFTFEISDLTLDANSINTTFSEHTLIGTVRGGAPQLRLNFANCKIRRVKLIRVYKFPNTSNGVRAGISLNSAHTASNEATRTSLTDILVEDYECYGGNQGCFVGSNNSGVTAGQGFNVFYDRLRFVRYYHDTGVVPTNPVFAEEANLDIGSGAFGGSVHIEDFYGANSNDVGIEVDNCQNLTMSGSNLIVDAWNSFYYVRNFRAPLDLGSQVNRLYGIARNVNVDPGSAGSGKPVCNHFSVGGDNSTAGYVFGHAIFEGASQVLTGLGSYNSFGLSVEVGNVQVRRVTIPDLVISVPNLNIAPASANLSGFCWVDIRPANANAKVEVGRVAARLAGTRSGAGAVAWKILRVAVNAKLTVHSVGFDIAGLTGVSANDLFYYVLLGDGIVSTIAGEVRGVRCLTPPQANANHYGITASSTGTLTIQGKLIVGSFDMANAGGFGFDYNIDASQTSKVWVQNYVTNRTGHGILAAAAAITVDASPFTYTNNDLINENVTIAGGAVSSVVLGQGGNVAVATAGTYLLRPGDTLVVTYTSAPTMMKSPVI